VQDRPQFFTCKHNRFHKKMAVRQVQDAVLGLRIVMLSCADWAASHIFRIRLDRLTRSLAFVAG